MAGRKQTAGKRRLCSEQRAARDVALVTEQQDVTVGHHREVLQRTVEQRRDGAAVGAEMADELAAVPVTGADRCGGLWVNPHRNGARHRKPRQRGAGPQQRLQHRQPAGYRHECPFGRTRDQPGHQPMHG